MVDEGRDSSGSDGARQPSNPGAQPGGDSAFVQLVSREHRGLLAAATMIVADAALAEEIVQDVLERTYGRWHKVSTMDRPGAWVRRAVINQSISSIRRRGSERRAIRRLRAVRATDQVHSPTPAPEIWAAVRALPDNQVTAVALHYGVDLSVRAVADEMDLSESAVKTLLYRARCTLRADPAVRRSAGTFGELPTPRENATLEEEL